MKICSPGCLRCQIDHEIEVREQHRDSVIEALLADRDVEANLWRLAVVEEELHFLALPSYQTMMQ